MECYLCGKKAIHRCSYCRKFVCYLHFVPGTIVICGHEYDSTRDIDTCEHCSDRSTICDPIYEVCGWCTIL